MILESIWCQKSIRCSTLNLAPPRISPTSRIIRTLFARLQTNGQVSVWRCWPYFLLWRLWHLPQWKTYHSYKAGTDWTPFFCERLVTKKWWCTMMSLHWLPTSKRKPWVLHGFSTSGGFRVWGYGVLPTCHVPHSHRMKRPLIWGSCDIDLQELSKLSVIKNRRNTTKKYKEHINKIQ